VVAAATLAYSRCGGCAKACAGASAAVLRYTGRLAFCYITLSRAYIDRLPPGCAGHLGGGGDERRRVTGGLPLHERLLWLLRRWRLHPGNIRRDT